MRDLQQLSRVLYRHDWADVEDWADSVARLADLTDDEIASLAEGGDGTQRGVDGALADDARGGGVRARCGQLCALLALTFGVKYRRA